MSFFNNRNRGNFNFYDYEIYTVISDQNKVLERLLYFCLSV